MFCDRTAEQVSAAAQAKGPKILVVGLGNPILGDDGIGWRVAEALQERSLLGNSDRQDLDIDCYALGGLSLMEHLIGYDAAVIIDAIQTDGGVPGSVYDLSLDDLPRFKSAHLTAAHDTSLQTALEVGSMMGAQLPQIVAVIGVEAKMVYEFSEKLSPAVEACIPQAVNLAQKRIEKLRREMAVAVSSTA
ncbi:MAG: hydrogenase maturation protease [Candidatus Promineifilaceae bacterium]